MLPTLSVDRVYRRIFTRHRAWITQYSCNRLDLPARSVKCARISRTIWLQALADWMCFTSLFFNEIHALLAG